MARVCKLSVVVPLYNEDECVVPLVNAVRGALPGDDSWELILVDDGSEDATAGRAFDMAATDSRLRLLQLARNYGQTAAMQAGFDHARGDVVVSMDGDLQNDPLDIMRLVAKLDEGYTLVAGYRERRKDKWLTRKLPSWIANRLIAWITGVPIRDNGCSLKAYRRELLVRMRVYSDMHRFIPALAAASAGARIAEIAVRHHARRYGQSKYGLTRVAKVLGDLLTIKMIRSFRERPLLLFGIGAGASLVMAALFMLAAVIAHLSFGPVKANALVLPGASLLCFGLAGYLLMLGLIGEVALREEMIEASGNLPIVFEITA